jgi:hypothetical protein
MADSQKSTATTAPPKKDAKETLRLWAIGIYKRLTEIEAQLKASAGGKKHRKVKDPNAPKRARNGYMFYNTDHRARVTKDNPTITGKEIVKLLAKEWKQLSDKEKQPYLDKAQKDSKRYEEEKALYDAKKQK